MNSYCDPLGYGTVQSGRSTSVLLWNVGTFRVIYYDTPQDQDVKQPLNLLYLRTSY